MNLKKTVCILAAGVGSRVGSYSTYLNKSLLPIKKKAAISYIIDQFSNNTEFVIAIGHFGKQVKNFLKHLCYRLRKHVSLGLIYPSNFDVDYPHNQTEIVTFALPLSVYSSVEFPHQRCKWEG